MLIEFKVANFRSIREEQTFSLVAGKADKSLKQNLILRRLPGLSETQYLKGAAIYGANASGKTNVLGAMQFLANFVRRSGTKIQPGDLTGAEPFKLDVDSKDRPSTFEVTFVSDGTRFTLGMALDSTRVTEEYLTAYPKGLPQKWYHRTYDAKSSSYIWSRPSAAFKHDKSLQEKTRENSSYISIGAQFNHAQLTQIFDWFRRNLRVLQLSAEGSLSHNFTTNLMAESVDKPHILRLLRSADIGVSEAHVVTSEITVDDLKARLPPAMLADMEARGQLKPRTQLEIKLLHAAKGIAPLAFNFEDEESAGTRRFFALVGPWLDILKNGYTAFIDEIETSLHPLLVRELLKLVLSDQYNPKGAQIVFTTHSPVLLDSALLRRDQIWFTEKTPEGVTHLYPLTDYKPRQDEAIARGYLGGRYGAIPFIPDGLEA
jgi:AAA15 family ATPase/GTPase